MVKVRASLLLLVFFFASNAYAGYFCSAENKHGGISYQDGQNHVWEVLDFTFEHTSIIDSYIACMRFLDNIPKDWNLSTTLYPLYPEKESTVRLGFSDPLVGLCAKTQGCRLNPIYGVFRPIALIESALKKSPISELSYCYKHPHRSEDELDIEESDTKVQTVDLNLGKVVSIPEKNLEEQILEELNQKKPKRIFVSTMILSPAILHDVDEWLLKNPKSEAWVFFAFNLQVLEHHFPTDLAPKSPNLHLFPVFQTPMIEETFHIKGLALESAHDKSTWIMTVNLRRFREEKVADRLIELKGEDPFHSYTRILSDVLEQQCNEIEHLKCSTGLRYGLDDDRSKQIEAWVEDACSKRFHSEAPTKQIFYRGGTTAIEDGILEWIGSAKKEIQIASHILNDSSATDALMEAADRGVKITVLVGTEMKFDRWLKHPNPLIHVVKKTHEDGLVSHAKFMVIDHEIAIWGTGNFTRTSLHNPWEIFLATRNPKMVSALEAYFKQYGSDKP